MKTQSTEEKFCKSYIWWGRYLCITCNSAIKGQIAQLKNGQWIWIDISSKKIYKWPISTRKDVQHHQLSGKCKSKHKATSSHTQWNRYYEKELVSVGEDVEKLEPSHTAGGNGNAAATLENSVAVPRKVKHRIIVWPSYSTPKCIPLQKNSCIIHNSPKVETTHLFTNW